MSGKLPAVLLYVAEYLADTRGLTNEQKGFYVDILCYMHISPRRGHLQQPSGKPFSNEQLAKMTGCSAEIASRLLQELIDAAVISVTADRLPFSRRMVRDEHKRQLCKEAGRKGGNPTLKGGLYGQSKGRDKQLFEDEDSSLRGGRVGGGPGEGGREEVTAAMVRAFGLRPVTEDELADLDALTHILTLKGAKPSDVEDRKARYRKTWPAMECNPRSLVRWWDRFAPTKPPAKAESASEKAAREAQEREEADWLALPPEERDRRLADAFNVFSERKVP